AKVGAETTVPSLYPSLLIKILPRMAVSVCESTATAFPILAPQSFHSSFWLSRVHTTSYESPLAPRELSQAACLMSSCSLLAATMYSARPAHLRKQKLIGRTT